MFVCGRCDIWTVRIFDIYVFKWAGKLESAHGPRLAFQGQKGHAMKIFGYSGDSDQLQELLEVTFQAQPEQLRTIANFLTEMADGLEQDRDNFGHGHLKDYCDSWLEEYPEMIVFKPD
jgi:hypothetical protein